MSTERRESRTIGSSRFIVGRDGRRYAFADHNCFACGDANPIGMKLVIELGEGTATTTWTPGPDFVGWEDKVHGGLRRRISSSGMLGLRQRRQQRRGSGPERWELSAWGT